MTSVEKRVLEPPNLNIFCGRIPPNPPKRLVSSPLARVSLLYKKPSYGPAVQAVILGKIGFCIVARESRSKIQT